VRQSNDVYSPFGNTVDLVLTEEDKQQSNATQH